LAYLPEFKNDLFISYRRAINEGPDRWVSSFQKALHLSLKQLVGDKVVIWRDEEQLHTGDNWRDKLVEALESAAIYLAIISRTYLESRECRNELDLMLAMLRADLGKRQHRIFPVYVHPPRSGADVPAELQGTHHREFFERRDDAPLGFSELDARPDCLEFQQRLARLAQEVTVALERLRDDSLTRFIGGVFVADVEPGLCRDRDNLCADLFALSARRVCTSVPKASSRSNDRAVATQPRWPRSRFRACFTARRQPSVRTAAGSRLQTTKRSGFSTVAFRTLRRGS
jgi:TIR domain